MAERRSLLDSMAERRSLLDRIRGRNADDEDAANVGAPQYNPFPDANGKLPVAQRISLEVPGQSNPFLPSADDKTVPRAIPVDSAPPKALPLEGEDYGRIPNARGYHINSIAAAKVQQVQEKEHRSFFGNIPHGISSGVKWVAKETVEAVAFLPNQAVKGTQYLQREHNISLGGGTNTNGGFGLRMTSGNPPNSLAPFNRGFGGPFYGNGGYYGGGGYGSNAYSRGASGGRKGGVPAEPKQWAPETTGFFRNDVALFPEKTRNEGTPNFIGRDDSIYVRKDITPASRAFADAYKIVLAEFKGIEEDRKTNINSLGEGQSFYYTPYADLRQDLSKVILEASMKHAAGHAPEYESRTNTAGQEFMKEVFGKDSNYTPSFHLPSYTDKSTIEKIQLAFGAVIHSDDGAEKLTELLKHTHDEPTLRYELDNLINPARVALLKGIGDVGQKLHREISDTTFTTDAAKAVQDALLNNPSVWKESAVVTDTKKGEARVSISMEEGYPVLSLVDATGKVTAKMDIQKGDRADVFDAIGQISMEDAKKDMKFTDYSHRIRDLVGKITGPKAADFLAAVQTAEEQTKMTAAQAQKAAAEAAEKVEASKTAFVTASAIVQGAKDKITALETEIAGQKAHTTLSAPELKRKEMVLGELKNRLPKLEEKAKLADTEHKMAVDMLESAVKLSTLVAKNAPPAAPAPAPKKEETAEAAPPKPKADAAKQDAAKQDAAIAEKEAEVAQLKAKSAAIFDKIAAKSVEIAKNSRTHGQPGQLQELRTELTGITKQIETAEVDVAALKQTAEAAKITDAAKPAAPAPAAPATAAPATTADADTRAANFANRVVAILGLEEGKETENARAEITKNAKIYLDNPDTSIVEEMMAKLRTKAEEAGNAKLAFVGGAIALGRVKNAVPQIRKAAIDELGMSQEHADHIAQNTATREPLSPTNIERSATPPAPSANRTC